MNTFTITTQRLGLRNWTDDDIEPFFEMCQDNEVMRHFPHQPNRDQVVESIRSSQEHFANYGFTYFATELLETGEFIGFVGLKHQSYESPFTPCVDIGWRIQKAYWGKGYATEAARACLEYAFAKLGLESVLAVCANTNLASEAVMKKIGMRKIGTFNHPTIPADSHLNPCLAYRIEQQEFPAQQ